MAGAKALLPMREQLPCRLSPYSEHAMLQAALTAGCQGHTCALPADLCIDVLPCQLLLCRWLLLIRGKQHQLPICDRHELLDDLQPG